MSAQQLHGILQVQIARGGQDELPIYQSILRLGRGRQNDVVLEDPNVSGRHAQFVWGRDGWLVEDLNSSNGTYLNGQRLPPRKATPLRPGDAVRIDEFTFQIQSPQAKDHVPPRLGDKVQISSDPAPGLAVYVSGRVEKYPLDKGVVTVGRGSDNDVQLNDPLVSGHHARLERLGNTYRIVDLGSTNGLTYQGQRVAQHVLADGDVLYIGQTHRPPVPGAHRLSAGARPKSGIEDPKTQYLDMRRPAQAEAGASPSDGTAATSLRCNIPACPAITPSSSSLAHASGCGT